MEGCYRVPKPTKKTKPYTITVSDFFDAAVGFRALMVSVLELLALVGKRWGIRVWV